MQPAETVWPAERTLDVNTDDDRIDHEDDHHEDAERSGVDQPAGHDAGRLEARVHDLDAIASTFSRCHPLPRLQPTVMLKVKLGYIIVRSKLLKLSLKLSLI